MGEVGMTPRNVIRFGGAAVCLVGMMLLIATGSIASALGAPGGAAVWNSNAGWVLAGTLLLMAVACTVSTVRDATGQAV
jgi:hypothetical protein